MQPLFSPPISRQPQPPQPAAQPQPHLRFNPKGETMNAITLEELLQAVELVAGLAIHDSHKLNIFNALFAGVKAAGSAYLQDQAPASDVPPPPALASAA